MNSVHDLVVHDEFFCSRMTALDIFLSHVDCKQIRSFCNWRIFNMAPFKQHCWHMDLLAPRWCVCRWSSSAQWVLCSRTTALDIFLSHKETSSWSGSSMSLVNLWCTEGSGDTGVWHLVSLPSTQTTFSSYKLGILSLQTSSTKRFQPQLTSLPLIWAKLWDAININGICQ